MLTPASGSLQLEMQYASSEVKGKEQHQYRFWGQVARDEGGGWACLGS